MGGAGNAGGRDGAALARMVQLIAAQERNAGLVRDAQLGRRYLPINATTLQHANYRDRGAYLDLPVPGLNAMPVNPNIPVEVAREYAIEQYGGVRPPVKILEPQRQFGQVISQVTDLLDNQLFKGREAQVNMKSDIFYRMMRLAVASYKELMITENFGPHLVSTGDFIITRPHFFVPISVNVRFNKVVQMRSTHNGLTLYLRVQHVDAQAQGNQDGRVLVPIVNFGKTSKRSYEFTLAPYYGYSDTMYNLTSTLSHNAATVYRTGQLPADYTSLCTGARLAVKSADVNTFYNRLSLQLPRNAEISGYSGISMIARTLASFADQMIARRSNLLLYGIFGAPRPAWMAQPLYDQLNAWYPPAAQAIDLDPHLYADGMRVGHTPYQYVEGHFMNVGFEHTFEWNPLTRRLDEIALDLDNGEDKVMLDSEALEQLLLNLATDLRHYLNATLVASQFVLQLVALPRRAGVNAQNVGIIEESGRHARTFINKYAAPDLLQTGSLGIGLHTMYSVLSQYLTGATALFTDETVTGFVSGSLAIRPFKLTPNNPNVTAMPSFVEMQSAVDHVKARAVAAANIVLNAENAVVTQNARAYILDLSGVVPQTGLTVQVAMTHFANASHGLQYLYTQQWLRGFNYTKKLELEKIAGARVEKYVKADTNNLKQLVTTLGGKYNGRE